MASKKVLRAVRRGHWFTLIQPFLFIGFMAFILVYELGFAEGLIPLLKLPDLSSLLRW